VTSYWMHITDNAAGVDPDFDDDDLDMRFLAEEAALEGVIKLHPGGWGNDPPLVTQFYPSAMQSRYRRLRQGVGGGDDPQPWASSKITVDGRPKLTVAGDVSRSQRAAARPAVQGAERVSGAGEVDHGA
jgi:hypothetical protein